MRTSFGKLAIVAFAVLMAILLLAPMRFGIEDELLPSVYSIRMEPGSTYELKYTVQSERIQTVSFDSDDTAIATIDQAGQITALKPGKTKINLRTQGGAVAEVDVEVTGVAITSFMLNTDWLEMEKGDVSGLSCVFNEGAATQGVKWMTSDAAVVEVDAAGRLTAVGTGEATVTAVTVEGFSASATVRVYVQGTAVQIKPDSMTVGVGASFPLTIDYLPEDATDTVVSWRSNQPDVVSVDDHGMIRARSVGTAVVTVTTKSGLIASAAIVVEPSAKAFQINPTSITIERGDEQSLDARFINENGETETSIDHHISWTSTNPEVATVEDGALTAHASGVTQIVASADGHTATCNVRVQTTVRSVTLNMTEQYLLREQTSQPFQLRAILEPADADNLSLTYQSDNSHVATVSSEGLVTLTGGYGTAVITASSANGAQATFTVHVVTQLPSATEEPQRADEE